MTAANMPLQANVHIKTTNDSHIIFSQSSVILNYLDFLGETNSDLYSKSNNLK